MFPNADFSNAELSSANEFERRLGLLMTRRQLFARSATSIGAAALASLLPGGEGCAGAEVRAEAKRPKTWGGLANVPHFAPQAKRVIYLFQNGGPAHIDLFDHKPDLGKKHKMELPDSVRMGQRLTGMTSSQKSFPVAASMFRFQRHGECGHWLSELLPHTANVADDLAIVKSVHTEAINHDPAVTYIQTGQQFPGRPSMGAWLSYGIGNQTESLPAYVVLISLGSSKQNMQPLYSRMWGSGFLPSTHQGVRFRSTGDPVLFLSNPPGIDGSRRRKLLDGVARLNRLAEETFGDPEIDARISQYEMAYRMQTSVPDLMSLDDEPDHIFKMYGEDARRPGTFAANCLLARRMAERGVRFIQLFHRGWDQHGNLPRDLAAQCRDTDQASAALVKDLKMRGMLDDTLVIWGGEFGRTVYCQGTLTPTNYGRDHHGRCFSVWLAGGGIQGGVVHGETDDFCYNIVRDPVHIHDLNATILHCLGIDHNRLTFKFQGLDHRLTGVDRPVHVVEPILA